MPRHAATLRVRRSVVFSVVALLGLTLGAAHALYLGSGRFPTSNLTWQYYGTTSANGSYTSPVRSAMNTWTNTTDVRFTEITSGNWDVAQYVSSFGSTGWAGLAYICATNGACNNSSALNSTYEYCIAHENRTYQDNYSSTCRRAVAGHEAGHCLSLAHNNNTGSIMYTYVAGTCVTNPNSGDRADINARY